ncbi:MAG: hypothetical protein NVS4B5_14380 [Vulcanimicrobiaceae bacterium]
MLDRLKTNVGLKVLALAIASVGWAYLRLTPNPVIAARFVQQVTVPIATTGLRADEIARYVDRQAIVAIDVPRAGPPVSPLMLRAVLNLEGRLPGVYNVPVEVIAPKLEIKSLSPASVTLAIERIEERSFHLKVHYLGEARRGVVVGSISVRPVAATLRAPTSELARVASVRVDVPLPTGPAAFDAMLRPIATDERGADVVGIAVSPNLVRVSANFINAGKAP